MNLSAIQITSLDAAAAAAVDCREMRCQVGMADIYHAAGLLPPIEVAQGPRDWARAGNRSLIEEWVDECPYFISIYDRKTADPGLPAISFASAGDLLGFRLGHSLHHVAILLSGGRMVHVFAGHGIKIAPCIPDAWAKRIERVWRPVPERNRRIRA